jgi:hypothetical protein
MTHVAALHVLTPGSPAYAVAKLSAIGGLVALRVLMSRRSRANAEPASDQEAATPAPPRRSSPHPVSARKKRRRRRG